MQKNQRNATTPGCGPLRHYGGRGRGSDCDPGSWDDGEPSGWQTEEWSSRYQQDAPSRGASSSHQDPGSASSAAWTGSSWTAGDSRYGRRRDDRSWYGPYHPWRNQERAPWHSGEAGPWTAAGHRLATSQTPQTTTREWSRQYGWQPSGQEWGSPTEPPTGVRPGHQDTWHTWHDTSRSGWGSPTDTGGSSPPWRREATAWHRPRVDDSPANERGGRLPPLPHPGRIDPGEGTAAGFFVRQLQSASLGWSETWKRWRLNRPVPGGGRPTVDPLIVHDEAAWFVRQHGLADLLEEWLERTRAHITRGAATRLTGAGRGTRRGRDDHDGGDAEGQGSTRRRRDPHTHQGSRAQ